MGILIQGGRIVDAATDTDKKGDIYLEDGVITEIGEKLKIKDKNDRVRSFQRSGTDTERGYRDRFPGCCKRWCDNGCCNAEYNTGN